MPSPSTLSPTTVLAVATTDRSDILRAHHRLEHPGNVQAGAPSLQGDASANGGGGDGDGSDGGGGDGGDGGGGDGGGGGGVHQGHARCRVSKLLDSVSRLYLGGRGGTILTSLTPQC